MYLLRTRQPVWLALLAWLWLGLTAQLQAAPGTGQLKLLPGSYKILLYVMDPYRAYKAELELQVADNLTGINGRSSYDGRKCAGTLSATSLTASTLQLAESMTGTDDICNAASYQINLNTASPYAQQAAQRFADISITSKSKSIKTRIARVEYQPSKLAGFIQKHHMWSLDELSARNDPLLLAQYLDAVNGPLKQQAEAAYGQSLDSRYQQAAAANSVDALHAFRQTFPLAPQAAQALKQETALAFAAAKASDDLPAYATFLNNYPQAAERQAAQQLLHDSFLREYKISATLSAIRPPKEHNGVSLADSRAYGSCTGLQWNITIRPHGAQSANLKLNAQWRLVPNYSKLGSFSAEQRRQQASYSLNADNNWQLEDTINFDCIAADVEIRKLSDSISAALQQQALPVTTPLDLSLNEASLQLRIETIETNTAPTGAIHSNWLQLDTHVFTQQQQQLARAAKQKALQAEQQKIAAEEQRRAKELAAYMQQKNIGEQVCKEGKNTFGLLSVSLRAFVEQVSGDRMQLRISHTSSHNISYQGTTLRPGSIIWDDYDNWRSCE